MKGRTFLLFLARIFVGFIFAYAGWTKLLEPVENFMGMIAEYSLLPPALIRPVAVILPWIEFLSGVFLILGFQIRAACLAAGTMSLAFIGLILAHYFKFGYFHADCGCFGEKSLIHFSAREILLLDFLNCLLAICIAKSKKHLWTLDR